MDTIEEVDVQRIVEVIESYLEKYPQKRRKERLLAFKKALDIVGRKWILLDT